MGAFAGKSGAFFDLERIAKAAAQSSSPALILGELGVGKRAFARRLHSEGARNSAPFVEVNCAFEPLDEAGFFERLAAAGNGSLFLDEVSSLSQEAQEAALKAFSQGKIGGGGARLVCASSQDLERAAAEGKFLLALFDKLNAVCVRIPPLRERKDDILPLAEFFLRKFSAETKKNFTGFSDDANSALLAYDWPGNIRELKNSIERACLLGTPPLVRAQHFGMERADAYVPQSGQSLKDAVTAFKKHYVERALRSMGKNQAEVAAALGIQRTYLSRLLLELGIR